MGLRSCSIAAEAGICALLIALLCGCGSDTDTDMQSVEGPLSDGPDDALAYTESFLAHNPRALLQPDLLAIVDLEPTGGGDEDTCAGEDGVDCLPYFFADETLLTLSTDGAPEELDQMVLRDAAGGAVLTAVTGGASAMAIVPAGDYVLELHHVFAGADDAAPRLVFLQPGPPETESVDALAAAQRADQVAPQAPPTSMQLTATKDCIKCNFFKADLTNQNFDGATLSESTFDQATLKNTTFRDATMEHCSLLEVGGLLFPQVAPQFNGDFTGAVMTGSKFSFVAVPLAGFIGIFRDATLDMTRWKASGVDEFGCQDIHFRCATVIPDFRNADLRGSTFSAIRFKNNYLVNPKFDCTFQGADLTGADFTPTPPMKRIDLRDCRFDREPESGRITVLQGANLTNVRIHAGVPSTRGNLNDADLTNAILDGADLSNNPGLGAILARANLTGASIVGTRFSNADLGGATLTGVTPSFAGLDLRLTNFGDAVFAGVDLSHTDLSQARSFRERAPNFAGARLSDDTVGVNLAGQVFPPGFDGLKGANLSGADLTRTELLQADLEGATLNRVKAVGANFNFANLRRAKLRGADLGVQPGDETAAASLRGAFMTDVDLTDADLRSVNLAGAHLYGDTQRTLLIRTRLDSANFSKAICSGAHFSGSLNNAVFDGAQLVNTVFNGATLTNTKLDDAYLQGADFSSALGVTGAVLNNSAVSAAPGTWSFTEQDGTPFTIRFEATKLGPLATDPNVRCPNGSVGPCCPNNDLAACLDQKLKPVSSGPFPPVPACVPRPPRYDNCITPMPTRTPRPTPTPAPR